MVGHYRWNNLPLVGNWLLDDPTDGIKFKHYMWMKWIILGNSNIHVLISPILLLYPNLKLNLMKVMN